MKFRGDRRGWIAKRMDEYLAVQEVIERLRQFGADVETDSLDWLQRSFGEFAQLTEAVISVQLQNAPNGDEVLDYLVSQHERLLELRRLDLTGSNSVRRGRAATQRVPPFGGAEPESHADHLGRAARGALAAGAGVRSCGRHESEVAHSAAAGPSACDAIAKRPRRRGRCIRLMFGECARAVQRVSD